VDEVPALFPAEGPVPFERRVVERLVRGVQSIDMAVRRKDVDTAVENHETGFNANMCEQFADLVEQVSPSGLTLDVAFSPDLAPRSGVDAKAVFVVTGQHAEIAAEAAQRLRKLAIDPNQTVVGRVVRLKSDDNPSELLETHGSREVTVEWNSKPLGSQVRVRMILSPADYLLAVEAHKDGRSVQISGELERPGRSWRLSNPGTLKII
jgi:hypothetical protein